MLVWGGWDPADRFRRTAEGALYDPVLDTWSALSTTTSTPTPRSGFAYAWTGTEFIVWGGIGNQAAVLDDGALLRF